MKTLLIWILVCLVAGLNARPNGLILKDLLESYAEAHPNEQTDDQIGCEIPNVAELHEASPLNAIVDKRKVWPNGVVFYEIADPLIDDIQHAQLQAALKDLHANISVDGTPCVTFVESETEPNRVHITNCGATICSSSVGMVGGAQSMCLSERCYNAHGTLMHEFLHALGFWHEQMRGDRDEYVFINYDNIIEGKESNFAKYTEGINIDHLNTPYDYSSVMHYNAYHFAADPTLPTIIPLEEDAVIGQRLALTELDIERVQILYGCKQPVESIYFKHLDEKY